MIPCLGLPADSLVGRRPNIIFILTDDQGYGDMSCHGHPILKTPNMDRLHDEGVRFTDFHVSPTCAPTRAALLTGRHEFKNGVTHTILERERLTLEATTLAQVLKSAGYTTGIFGKWHLGDEPAYCPDRRGFDEVFIHGGGGIGQTYPGSCGDAPGNTYFNPTILHNGVFETTHGYCTDVFFNQAMSWIKGVKGRQPFFAYIACNAPHAPLQVRPEDEARYLGKVANTNAARYLGMVANIDDNIGRLLGRLREWDLERQTLVIFMNDNGADGGLLAGYNAGMRGGKGTAFLGGTRAASFWRWPGTLVPGDCRALTAHIDIFPTLAALAGAQFFEKVHAQVEGRSLVPLLANPDAPWPERVLFTHLGRWPKGADPNDAKYHVCAIRTPEWHLVSPDGGKAPHWMLFDVEKDFGETTDISADHPEVVEQLAARFDLWWDSLSGSLVNEGAIGPRINSFKELFWQQFGGGPSREDLRLMDMNQNPATAPSITVAQLPFLRELAAKVLASAKVPVNERIPGGPTNTTGYTLRVPGGTQNYYPAFWIRDAAMMLGGDFIPADEIEGWVRVIAATQPGADGLRFGRLIVPGFSIPDHITLGGAACWYPGAYTEQGNGTFGFLPPADDAFFFIHMVYEHWRLARTPAFFQSSVKTGWRVAPVSEICVKAFGSVAVNPDGLVQCAASEGQTRVDWGFCDSIRKEGLCLMPSLLRWQAARELAELFDASGAPTKAVFFRNQAATIRAAIPTTFTREIPAAAKSNGAKEALLLSATELGRKDDVWASAYAVWLGVLPPELEKAVSRHLLTLYQAGGTVVEGQVRHLPPSGEFGGSWEQAKCPRDTYQNGGFWATPTGWLIIALRKASPSASDKLLSEYADHLRANRDRGAPWEWVQPAKNLRVNALYGSSAGLVVNCIWNGR
jgi:arylsulfatase